MADETLAATSNTLFHVALVTYIVAMAAYFFRLAFTRVTIDGDAAEAAANPRGTARVVAVLGTALAVAGFGAHLASVVLRGAAAGRVPWGNMYEYGSALGLIAVGVGLAVVQRRMRLGHLVGFVLAAAVLMMASSLLLFTEAAPLQPALQSYWLQIHVSGMMVSSSIFIVGFVATALYLVKDAAERRLAISTAFAGSTVGAGGVATRSRAGADASLDADSGVEGLVGEADAEAVVASPLAQREVLRPLLFPVLPFAVIAAFTLWVWREPVAAMLAGSIAAVLGSAAWYAVPYLPPAARLDGLAYRVNTFAFPIITFGIMCGAIWAEEAWGRYWGWDPKETGAFVTWVLYACYLHARSTRGWRGRRAAWIGVAAFAALMVTYYAVNLFITGLHSYAGV